MDSSSYELTLEQQFQMRLMEESAHGMTREQALDLLIEASRLMMIKDNLIKDLMGHLPL